MHHGKWAPISQGARKLLLLCPGRGLGTHPDGLRGGGGPEGRGSPSWALRLPPATVPGGAADLKLRSILMIMEVVH